jgi:hypothetical protein
VPRDLHPPNHRHRYVAIRWLVAHEEAPFADECVDEHPRVGAGVPAGESPNSRSVVLRAPVMVFDGMVAVSSRA